MPSIWWPEATYTFEHPRNGPITGSPSGVTGRMPTHSTADLSVQRLGKPAQDGAAQGRQSTSVEAQVQARQLQCPRDTQSAVERCHGEMRLGQVQRPRQPKGRPGDRQAVALRGLDGQRVPAGSRQRAGLGASGEDEGVRLHGTGWTLERRHPTGSPLHGAHLEALPQTRPAAAEVSREPGAQALGPYVPLGRQEQAA
jgi:hypothetical protein